MKYIILNTEYPGAETYLASFAMRNSMFPTKTWSHHINDAIVFDNKEDAKNIIKMLRINTPDAMSIKEVNHDGYIPFKKEYKFNASFCQNIYFKSSKQYYPARIICWNRKGIKNRAGELVPIVALVEHPTQGEILMEATENGEAYSLQIGLHQALYIKHTF